MPLLQALAGVGLYNWIVVGGQLLESLAEHIAAGGGGKPAQRDIEWQLPEGVAHGDLIEAALPQRSAEGALQQHLDGAQQVAAQLGLQTRAGHLIAHQLAHLGAGEIRLEIQLLEDGVHQGSKAGSPG